MPSHGPRPEIAEPEGSEGSAPPSAGRGRQKSVFAGLFDAITDSLAPKGDEAEGAPDHGLAAGTKWADVPMNWTCPECGARKEDFEMVQI